MDPFFVSESKVFQTYDLIFWY